MKKIIKVLFVTMLMIIGFSISTMAAESVVGKGYKMIENNITYDAYFYQGPFSGGIGGDCKLYTDNYLTATYQFQQYDDIISVFDVGDFILIDGTLNQVVKWGLKLVEIKP